MDLTKTARQEKPPRRSASDHLPPHSIPSEQGVLGCIMMCPDECMTTAEEWGIGPGWFYDLRHEKIFLRMQQLRRMRKPIDLIMLMEMLTVSDELSEVGGHAYLSTLQDATPSAGNFVYYAEVLREKRAARMVLRVCSEVMGEVLAKDGITDAMMAKFESDVVKMGEDMVAVKTEEHINTVLDKVIDEMEEYHKGKLQINGLPTGYEMLDKVIGGIGPNYYCVVAGRPGSGKTTLAIDIIKHLTLDYKWWEKSDAPVPEGEHPKMVERTGIPIGVFSLEMTNKSLGRRLLFDVAQVSAGKFKQGFMSNDDVKGLVTARAKLQQANIYLDDAGAQTIGQICAKARRWAKQYGIKLFVIDYLQLVLPDKRAGRIDRVQELTDISAAFVQLKKQLNVPWLVLAQMNRNIETAESKRPPVLSDLKDCGAIEQDADVVTFLYQPERQHKTKQQEEDGDFKTDEEMIGDCYAGKDLSEWPQRINSIVAKNRDGASGISQLLFHKNQFRFEDWFRWKVRNGFAEAMKGQKM